MVRDGQFADDGLSVVGQSVAEDRSRGKLNLVRGTHNRRSRPRDLGCSRGFLGAVLRNHDGLLHRIWTGGSYREFELRRGLGLFRGVHEREQSLSTVNRPIGVVVIKLPTVRPAVPYITQFAGEPLRFARKHIREGIPHRIQPLGEDPEK